MTTLSNLSKPNEQLYALLNTIRQLSLSGEPAEDLQNIFRPKIKKLLDEGATMALLHPATGLPLFSTVLTDASFVDFVLEFPNVRVSTLNMTPFLDVPGPVFTKLAEHGLDVNRKRNGVTLLGFLYKMSTDNSSATSNDLKDQVAALLGAGADHREVQGNPDFEESRQLFDQMVQQKRMKKYKMIGKPKKTG